MKDLWDYETFKFNQHVLEEEAITDYRDALYQIKHHMDSHPKDIIYIIQVHLRPDLDEEKLKILAREFLHVNIEYRILGHHKDIYGNNLLSCIIRK